VIRWIAYRAGVTPCAPYLPVSPSAWVWAQFGPVYPNVEATSDFRTSFINHAHNAYLELLLEGGVAAAVLLAAYVTLLLLAMWRLPPSPVRTAAFCAIAFVLLHNGVEYALSNISLSLLLRDRIRCFSRNLSVFRLISRLS